MNTDIPLVTEAIDARVARRPDATALVDGELRLTYTALWQRVNRLARHLIAAGAGPERCVVLALARSADQVVATLAVLQSGAAYVPVEPEALPARLAQAVSDSRAALVLTTASVRAARADGPVWPGSAEDRGPAAPKAPAPQTVVLDDPRTAARIARLPAHTVKDAERNSPLRPGHPAYVIYTSGSTGRPKGVVVEHRALAHYVSWAATAYSGATGSAPLHSSMAYDMPVTTLYAPLTAGGSVEITDLRRGQTLAAGCALLKATPSHLPLLAALPDRASPYGELVLGGEQILGAALAPWRERHSQVAVVNEYGPTEATVGCVAHRIAPGDPTPQGAVPIGRPIARMRAYVLDAGLHEVAAGETGELCVAGSGLARGYLGRSSATAERFVPDPFGPPGERMYRTGDLARRSADGTLTFAGRADAQLKIRGHRVEPGEIEAALCAHPDVAQAAVVLRAYDGDSALVGYVTPAATGRAPTPDTIRAFATGLLPPHLVPRALVVLADLPRTANGKTDTSALPGPPLPADEDSRTAQDGETPTEARTGDVRVETVRDAMRTVLGRRSVGADANFFSLGGDSMTAARLVAELRRRGFASELAHVYEQRTPRALATCWDPAAAGAGEGGSAPGAGPFSLVRETDRSWIPHGAEDAFPATRLQRGMFLGNAVQSERVYHDVFSYVLDAALEEETLRKALRRLVRAHPALRSAFLLDGPSEPLQVVHCDAPCELAVADLRAQPAHTHRTLIEQWAAAEWERLFDLTRPGLFRMALHRTGAHASVLSLSVHHAVVDGWSEATMITELLRTYLAVRAGKPPERPHETRLLRGYVAHEREAERSAAHRDFWRDYLEGATPAELPAFPRPAEPEPTVQAAVTLPADTAAAFRRTAAAAGVPPRTAYLAAHLALLAFISGHTDVVTGLVVDGRPEQDGHDEQLGLFLNTVPVRVRVADESWQDLLTAVYESESATVRHRRRPFDLIQAESGFHPLCPAAFNYSDFRVLDRLGPHDIRVREAHYRDRTDFDLVVGADETPLTGGAVLTLTGRPDRMTVRQVRLYAGFLERVVTQAVTVPDEPVVRALANWAAAHGMTTRVVPEPPAPHGPSALSLVADRVRERPGALAQKSGEASMTYADLAARVSHLAARLRQLGAGPGTRVACFVEHNMGPLVALLGTWAAGASYVPLDPALPLARQRALLERAGCTAAVRAPEVDPAGTAWRGREALLKPVGARPERTVENEGQQGWMRKTDIDGWTAPGAADEAYLLFTSGSTGEPKAVSMPHGAMAGLVAWQITQPEFAKAARAAFYAPVSFDVSILEMLAAAAVGATLVAVPDAVRRDPQRLLAALAADSIDTVTLPVVMLHQLADVWAAGGPTPGALRHVVAAGESLLVTDTVRRFFEAAGAHLINSYGPTETHYAARHLLSLPARDWPDRPPIGLPPRGVHLRVYDVLRRPVPLGTPGELYIGGTGVASGYATADGTDPRTAENFLTLDGMRFYRTGDVVRGHGGPLEFLGRVDDQVKIRGFRVDPGEVAAVLAAHPSVRDCVVRPIRLGARGLSLVAYAVPNGSADAGADADTLMAHARALLPEYALPAHVEFLNNLPLTRHGKVDLRSLPAPRRPSGAARRREPGTETEQRVAEVWERVLGHPVPALDASFTEVGGTSLLLLPLHRELRHAFGREIPLRELLRLPTVRDIATALDTGNIRDSGETAPAPVGPTPEAATGGAETTWLPATPAQEGMWLDAQLLDSSSVRHLLLALNLHGRLDVDSLALAWQRVVAAHPALRAAFTLVRGRLRQRLPAADDPVPPLALRRVTEADVPSVVEELRTQPFDLAEGPPHAATLLRVGAAHHVLVLVVHHIVGDLGTQQLLLDELVKEYGEPGTLDPARDRYRAAVTAACATAATAADLDYWRARLPADPRLLPLPDPADGAETVSAGGSLAIEWSELCLSRETRARVGELAERHRVNPPLVLLTALVTALGPLAPAADRLLVGMPVSTRDRPEWAATAGLFLETLVLTVDRPGPSAEFGDVLAGVADEFAASWSRLMPFSHLVRARRPRRGSAEVPLVEVSFNYLSRPLAAPRTEGLRASLYVPEFPEGRFPLGIYCEEDDEEGTLRLRLGRQPARVPRPWADALAAGISDAVERGMGSGGRNE